MLPADAEQHLSQRDAPLEARIYQALTSPGSAAALLEDSGAKQR